MTEFSVTVGDRRIAFRDSGCADGPALIYVHGTPGSRLDVSFGDTQAQRMGVRVVSFDRPGYGGSDPAPYDLTSIVRDMAALADHLGIAEFAAMGWSGGGPFALAAGAVLGDRVTRIGVSGGVAPLQLMPGGLDSLTDDDRLALSYLPDDPARAAKQFSTGNAELLQMLISARDDAQAPWIDWLWGQSDPDVVASPTMRRQLFSVLHEGLRQGTSGIAWDNVAWCGPWGVDLDDIKCPVHLWYGEQDQMVAPVNGEWLRDNLADATLVRYSGEGHLVPMGHWETILSALTA